MKEYKNSMSEDYLHLQRAATGISDLNFCDLLFNKALIYTKDKLLSYPGDNSLHLYSLPTPNGAEERLPLPKNYRES